MACDMCGKEASPFRVRVEGTVMTVCSGCKNYGEIVREAKPKPIMQRREHAQIEKFVMVGEGYGKKIKHARESRMLKQEDLARKLHIKESQLHGYESEHHKPDIETAKKIERELGIRLIEEHIEEHTMERTRASGPLTIADMIKRKK